MTKKTARFALPSLFLPTALLLIAALFIRPLDAAIESETTRPETPGVTTAPSTPKNELKSDSSAPGIDSAEGEHDKPTRPAHPLRRLRKVEMTRDIALRAREIIHEHHHEPFGTEIPFESEEETYIARIEEHYHPPGGEAKPWGHHPGVSVLVRRPLPSSPR